MKSGDIIERDGKEYLVIGKTFGTKTKLPVGATVSVESEQANLERDPDGNLLALTLWAPEVMSKADGKPDSLKAVVERARDHGVLREKIRKPGNEVEYLPNESGKPETADKAGEADYPDESKKLRYVFQLHARGKSVSDLTPLIVRENGGTPHVRFISELWPENARDSEVKLEGWEVWGSSGWEQIKYIFQHKTHEKVTRLNCHGGAIDVTDDHSLYQDGQPVLAGNLKQGDQIDLIGEFPPIPEDSEVSPGYAWLLGLWVAEGYYRRGKSATICNSNLGLLEKGARIAHEHGFSTSIYKNHESYKLEISGWHIFERFIFQGPHIVRTARARLKRLPPFVFGWDKKSKLAFFEGYLEGDGDHALYKKDCRDFSTSSQALAQGFLLLANQLFPELDYTVYLQENLFRIKLVNPDHNRYQKERNGIKSLMRARTGGDSRGELNPNFKDGRYQKTRMVAEQYFSYSAKRAVYDIETESHSFMAGVGRIRAHNSVHGDLRVEYKRGDEHYLEGWTIALQQPGAIKEPITTLEQLKKAAANPDLWKMDLKTGLVKPRQIRGGTVRRGDLRAFQKAAEIPADWLNEEGVTDKPDPGEPVPVGATREYPGVFLIVSKGEVEWGAIKPWFTELFLDGDWKGRWAFRLIQRKGEKFYAPESEADFEEFDFNALKDFWTKADTLPPGMEEETPRTEAMWLLMQPNDQTPYSISKEAISEDWLPPKGVSALPKKIRSSVLKELRYWEQNRKRALESRRKLAEDYEELGGPDLKAEGRWVTIRGKPVFIGGTAGSRKPRGFKTTKEARRWAQTTLEKNHDNLTALEKEVVSDYGGDGFDDANIALRKRRDPDPEWVDVTLRKYDGADIDDYFSGRITGGEVLEKFTKPLDNAIEKSPMPEDVVVYRGFGSMQPEKFAVGKSFRDRGYASTSLSEQEAMNFANKNGVLAKITLKSGQKGLYIGKLGREDEAEILLPRNSVFKIVGKKKAGDVYLVDLEVTHE